MNRGNPEGLAAPGAIAIPVEPLDDFFDAERARVAIAVEIQLKNEPDRFRFDSINV